MLSCGILIPISQYLFDLDLTGSCHPYRVGCVKTGVADQLAIHFKSGLKSQKMGRGSLTIWS